MTLTFGQTATFAALWKHWKLNDDDLRALEQQLIENPLVGKVMRNTGGVRKMRFAPPSRGYGKSGAFRVCYFHLPVHSAVQFVLIFPKNEQPNLTSEQQRMCQVLSRQVKDAWSRSSAPRGKGQVP